jgi:flagellar basal-body rod protein FlgB
MFETRTGVLARSALDGLASRHRAFANNLANLETPGFQPGDVPFEAHLRQVRDELIADPSAPMEASPARLLEVVPDDQAANREDQNGVQADRQMIRLEENTLTYEALAQATRLRAGLMRNVLTEGRG